MTRILITFSLLLTVCAALAVDTEHMILFEFSSPKGTANWYDQNDTVMGGVSSSAMTYTNEGVAKFAGEVSLENNGGFAQVQYDKTGFDLNGYEGLELRIEGAPKTYQLRLNTDANRISYSQSFQASDEWMTVQLPFKAFSGVYRGRSVPDAPPLNLSDIRRVGLMISDKQEGNFELLIDHIRAY